MLPSKNRVKSGFFDEKKKPVFVKTNDSVSIKVYKSDDLRASVIVPKKVLKNAVDRNTLKRKILPKTRSLPNNTYLIYVKKDNLKEILDAISHIV